MLPRRDCLISTRHRGRRPRQVLRRGRRRPRRVVHRRRRARSSASSAPTAPARARRSTCSARWPSPRPGAARVSGFDVVSRARRRAPPHRPRLPGPDARRPPHRRRRTSGCTPSCTASTPASSRPGWTRCSRWSTSADRRDQPVMTFSGGMKRRLEIARGLMHSPRVLFLDEPTIGLDPQTRSSIWRYIRALQETEGTTIFMTTHYMDEAEFCDRIAIMDRGEIVVLDTPEALKAERRGRPRGAGHGRRRRGAGRAAGPLRHRGRGGRGRGDVPRRERRGVRPAAVRRARTSPSRRSPSRGRRWTTSSCATRARRSGTRRPAAAGDRNRAMMRAMAGAKR